MTGSAELPDLATLLRDDSWLRRLARQISGRADDVDDLVQEALLAAVEAPPPKPARFGAWIRTVLRHLAAHRGRRERERPVRELAAVRDRARAHQSKLVQEVQLKHQLMEAVLGLPEPWQTAVVLRYYADLTSAEIGERMQAPEGTVRYWLHRGLQDIRARLEKESGSSDLRALLLPMLGGGAPVAKAAAGAEAVAAAGMLMSAKTMLVACGMILLVLAVGGTLLSIPSSGGSAPVLPTTAEFERNSQVGSSVSPELPSPKISTQRFVERPLPSDTTTTPPFESEEIPFPSTSLSGQVLAPNGDPIPGADVFAGSPKYSLPGIGSGDLREAVPQLVESIEEMDRSRDASAQGIRESDWSHAKTDSDGRFRMAIVPENLNLLVFVYAEGHGTLFRRGVSAIRDHTNEVELRYDEGFVVHGIVSANGRPVRDASIVVRSCREGGNWPPPRFESTYKTNEAGEYSTTVLQHRRLSISAWATEGRADAISIEAAPTETRRRLDIDLRDWPPTLQQPRVTGRLLAADGHAGSIKDRITEILGAGRVSRSIENEFEVCGTCENTIDRCAWGRVQADGNQWVMFIRDRRPRFVSVWFRGLMLGTAEMTEGPTGPDVLLDLRLIPRPRPLGSLSIRVRDAADGRPLLGYARAQVTSADQEAEHRESQHHDAWCKEPGKARIDGLEEGRWLVSITCAGFGPWTGIVNIAGGAEPASLDVQLVRAVATVGGRVLDPTGKPVANASIVLRAPDGHQLGALFRSGATETNGDGLFLYSALAPGHYLVHVRAPDLALGAFTVRADSGEPRYAVLPLVQGVLVRFEPAGTRGVALRFRIEDGSRRLIYENFDEAAAINSHASFRLAPGRYYAEVRCPPFRPAHLEFEAEDGATIKVPQVE